MAFEDDFASCMTNAGIHMDASVVPDAATLGPILDYIKQWMQALDSDIQTGLDQVTKDDPTSVILADSDLNVVNSAYQGLLEAFDAATGFPLSLCIQWCDYCVQQASATVAQ